MGRKKKDPDLSKYSGRIAARLRLLREERGLTVDEIVDRLRARGVVISTTTFHRYEAGMRVLPPDLYPVLAATLGKSVRAFMPVE